MGPDRVCMSPLSRMQWSKNPRYAAGLTQGELGPYHELLAQFHSGPSASTSASSTSQLRSWLGALSHVAPSLDRSCAELVDAVVEFPWLAMPDEVAEAWVRFVCALVSARSEWVSKVATLIFRNFGLNPEWYRDAEALALAADAARPTRRQLYDRLHGLLQNLLRLIPTLPSTLQPRLVQHFPHKRDRTLSQVLYIRNLLRVTEYCEALTEPIWSAVIDHALQVDVEIQVELDDLEEQGVEPANVTTLASVLDRGVEDIDGESAPSSPVEKDEDLEALEDLDEEDGYEASDSLLPSHPTEHEPQWNEIAVLAGKLDAIMKAIFDFLAHYVGHGSSLRGGAHTQPVDVRRYQLYQTLLGIFTRSVLTTFKSRHVQFLLFWYSSLDSEFADMFLGTLLSKSLYAPGAHADAPFAPTSDSAAFLRIAAASYVASYVARAKYIDGSTTRMVLLNLCTYLDACLESFAQLGSSAPPPGSREHAMFYAVAQAVFYLFCFRWRDLRQGGSTLESTSHEDASLASTYPTACSLELSPQLLPTLNGTSYSSASSSTSGPLGTSLASEAGWAPGLAVVQRAITSPLNPLRYCNGNVVQQFAYVAQHTGFLYCYSVLDANARRAQSEAPQPAASAPGTPQRKGSRDARESTPLAVPKTSEAPAPVPAKALDVFFPFDPYRLRDSGPMVHRLYREWSDVAPEDDDDEDEDEDHPDDLDLDHHDEDEDDELGGLPSVRRTKLSAMMPRRPRATLSSMDPSSITPESVAQSLEAMSISPYTG